MTVSPSIKAFLSPSSDAPLKVAPKHEDDQAEAYQGEHHLAIHTEELHLLSKPSSFVWKIDVVLLLVLNISTGCFSGKNGDLVHLLFQGRVHFDLHSQRNPRIIIESNIC